MTPEQLVVEIHRLSHEELRELLRLLKDFPPFEGVGVREPRRPLPEDDEGHGIPEDYWETAE